ncbi:FG-GAP-like repeat-containing protein [Nonomuraea zeae]|uniref:VCBS repeat-containing protein n=1 Tax=Nonomuraea zeae TaxID=1642303 RepID=A0A5S4GNW2_9ACTN|nr:FG-GAP-like repeat-containing protein [Nonomuraea zeae]TMR28040.1 hypothetical protein ETD85_37105 [Nonomuraea zeae]
MTIGAGWGGYTLAGLADWDRDGHVDVIARDGSGGLWLYPGSGARSAYSGSPARFEVGSGWYGYQAFTTPDIDDDGKIDIVADPPDTTTWYGYQGTGTRPGGRVPVGDGLDRPLAQQHLPLVEHSGRRPDQRAGLPALRLHHRYRQARRAQREGRRLQGGHRRLRRRAVRLGGTDRPVHLRQHFARRRTVQAGLRRPAPSPPLARWKLSDPAGSKVLADATGNGRDLTVTGTPTLGAPGRLAPADDGEPQTAMRADGTNGYASSPDLLNTTKSFSVSA